MPSRPSKLTDLSQKDAVHVINQLFAEYAKRIDDVQKQATIKRISSQSKLVFGTIAANSCVEAVVNLLGARTDKVAHANPTLPVAVTAANNAFLTWSAYVSAAGQVKVRVCNISAAGIPTNTVLWNILVS